VRYSGRLRVSIRVKLTHYRNAYSHSEGPPLRSVASLEKEKR